MTAEKSRKSDHAFLWWMTMMTVIVSVLGVMMGYTALTSVLNYLHHVEGADRVCAIIDSVSVATMIILLVVLWRNLWQFWARIRTLSGK